MTIAIPYLESGQQKVVKTSIDFVSFVRLISNMHHSIAFEKVVSFDIYFIFADIRKFNIYDVIDIYDVIALMNRCKI